MMQVQPLPSASKYPSEPITRSEGQDMAERDAHPYLGHHQELINNKRTGVRMKSQKKLDRFKLTEEEKKAIRKQERYESTIDSILLVLAIIAGIVMLIAVMEIFG